MLLRAFGNLSLAWGTKLEYRDVMDLIEVDDVIERFEAFVAERNPESVAAPAAGPS